MSVAKKIRLEQKAMPVSSEEELSLITLREQNRMLSNNYNHRIRIENDLKKRIEQLESTLRLCEEKEPENQLTIINEDLRNKVDELECELNKVRLNERRLTDDLDRLNKEFSDIRRKFLQTNPDSIRNSTSTSYSDQHNHQNTNSTSSTGEACNFNNSPSIIDENQALGQTKAIQDLETKLADQIELANNRLKELVGLREQHTIALSTIDELRSASKCIPDGIIVESQKYKCLHSSFSMLWNEATQMKTQLDDSRKLIDEMKNAHAQQIEKMELEDARLQTQLRTNIVDLEQSLAESRNQNNILRLDFDNLSKVNDQIVKLDTELKKSVGSYKIQVQQKNNDLNRMKRLLEETKRERSHNESKSSTHATNNGDNLNNSVTNHSSSTQNPSKSTNNNNNNSSSSSTNNAVNSHSPSKLKEIIHHLQRQLDKTKSEEEALMQDLEITGQAYEDMQEQNHRLLQQIEEKDDANLSLMTEQLKANNFQKLLKDEKAQLETVRELQEKQIAAQGNVVRSLEEKIHLLQENMSTLEKELELRNNVNDVHKQEIAEMKQQLILLSSEKEKIMSQLSELQKLLSDRTASDTHQSFKNKRLMEELDGLKKKYERASKLQSASTPDEVLMEEIREYKEQLTCPSCKTAPKDAVLTKCFHVFCYECLKARVDTRQRKCPKCNAQFGASDFHRLYLA